MLSRYVVSQVKHNSYFLVGLAVGLWVSLVAVPLEDAPEPCAVSTGPFVDEYEPVREERPLSGAGQAGRSVQRPRYYSTELGMRGALLAGALSSQAALETRVAALNRTAALLQPALRFFITASGLAPAPGLANVVGFTDPREMLKPFHALKYLADNYLEEYDFFFLVSDTSYVNARRLTELVAGLSVSQDIYMGTIADDDSHYCTLEGGILLSNSVLRAVHGELDWCVRNSYSASHHENLGRCVLHAAHVRCTQTAQGTLYTSIRLESNSSLPETLGSAVTAHPVTEPADMYRIHAYVSRLYLERGLAREVSLRRAVWRERREHPCAGCADPSRAKPLPDNRFDHLRWTVFNASHSLLPDDHRAVCEITGAYREALDLVLREASTWLWARHAPPASPPRPPRPPPPGAVTLVEGARRWQPAEAHEYRLLLRLKQGDKESLHQLQVSRPLGRARLLPVRYVTESARVTVVLPVRGTGGVEEFLKRYEAVALQRDGNTALVVVALTSDGSPSPLPSLRSALASLSASRPRASLDALETSAPCASETPAWRECERDARSALEAALPRLGKDALVLMADVRLEFNEEFLNRVRMNSIPGAQWYSALPFSRYQQYRHPRFRDARGVRPASGTGHFRSAGGAGGLAAFYKQDALAALSLASDASLSLNEVLSRAPLRCLRAPEPGAVLGPPPPACPANKQEDKGAPEVGDLGPPDVGSVGAPNGPVALTCAREAIQADPSGVSLHLGARQALATMLLQLQARV